MENSNKLMLTLFLGVLMGALDISIVGPAIPSIEKSILIPEHEIGWIFSIYVLFNLVGISLFARLSDLYGRRIIYIIAIIIFAIGSIWVALSSNFQFILIGRSIQGFGASGIFPVASAVIGDKFPIEKRGKMLGLIGMVFGIAFIIGPIIAGVMLLLFSWNSLFYINIPIAIFLIYYSYKYLPSKQTSEVFKFDWKGALLLGITLSSFALFINNLRTSNFINSILEIKSLILFSTSFIGCAAFIWFELRVLQPILNVRYIKKKQIFISGLLSIGTGFFQALFTFLPKLAVGALKVSLSNASFLLLPAVIATAIGSPLFGRMLDKYGSRIVIFTGMVFMTLGMTVAYFFVNSFLVFFVAGIFIGLSLSILSGSALRYIVLNELPAFDRASGQGLVTIFISIGQMVNATIIGSIIAGGVSLVSGYKNAFLFLIIISLLLLMSSLFLNKK
jgi:MFS family permease